MNRRKFIKLSSMAGGAIAFSPSLMLAQTKKATTPASSGAPGTGKVDEDPGHYHGHRLRP